MDHKIIALEHTITEEQVHALVDLLTIELEAYGTKALPVTREVLEKFTGHCGIRDARALITLYGGIRNLYLMNGLPVAASDESLFFVLRHIVDIVCDDRPETRAIYLQNESLWSALCSVKDYFGTYDDAIILFRNRGTAGISDMRLQ